METMCQLVPGSGEGQHTGTIDDYHGIERKEAHVMWPPSLLVTISYYSIPSGLLGGASISINRVQATGNSVRCASAFSRA
jgi:hypothetical protein